MGKIFPGFALYSQKGLCKRKDSRLRGENSGGFASAGKIFPGFALYSQKGL